MTNAAGIHTAEIEDVVTTNAGRVKRTGILQHESPAGRGVQICFHDQALGRRKHGDAEDKRSRGVGEIDDAAAVGLNGVSACSERQHLRAVERRVDVLEASGDVAVAIGDERADTREET